MAEVEDSRGRRGGRGATSASREQGLGGVDTWLQLDLQLADWAVLSQELHLPVQGIQAEGRLQAGEGSTWTVAEERGQA